MKSIFLIFIFLCTNQVSAKNTKFVTVVSEKDDKLSILSDIDRLHRLTATSLKNKSHSGEFRIFETSGGDPAMNGNRIYISACSEGEAEFKCFVFKDILDLNSVTKTYLNIKNNLILVEGTEDVMSQQDEIVNKKVTYEIKYDWSRSGEFFGKLQISKK